MATTGNVRLRREALSSCLALCAGVSALALSAPAMAQDAQQGTAATAPSDNGATTPAAAQSTQSAGATQPSASTTPPNGTDSGSTSIQASTGNGNNTVTAAEVGQTSPDTAAQQITVTGIRQSLATAQSIKRNADTVVDAISAEDIGALPDRSINEALQRVPGIAISRFAAPSDSQHFSVQGSGITLRGLDGFELSEFNGRDTFGVGNSRGIGYNDVPSELAGSVEVFKNLTPDMIEGGISGVISINTRKPFDQKGQVVYLSGSVNYGDLEKKAAPSFVGLFSKQFDLGDGSRFGVLVGGSYDRLFSRADSIFTASYLPRFNNPNDGVDGYAVNGDYQGSQYDGNLCDGNNPNEGRLINQGTPYQIRECDAFPVPAGLDTVYTPSGAGIRQQTFDVRRKSLEGALQWENADRSFLVTASYLRADYYEHWFDHTFEPNIYYNDIGQTYPADGTNYTFDDGGVFTSGTIQRLGNTQAHNTPNDPCTIPNNGFPYQSTYCPYTNFVNPNGINTDFSNRSFLSKSTTQDASFNIKWEPTSRLHINLDGQWVGSKFLNTDDIVDIYTFSNIGIDLTGKTPQIQFLSPGFDPQQYFGNPNSLFFNDAFDNEARDTGHEWAFRGDAQYDVSDDGFFKAVRFGARYSDREQTVRSNDYNNWGSLSATWTDQGPSYLTNAAGDTTTYNWPDFFRGAETTRIPSVPFIADSILGNHDKLMDLLRSVKDNTNPGQFSYTPLEDGYGCAKADLVDKYFCPNQVYKNSEKTYAAYARLDFGTHEFAGGMKLSGNVGVRFVRTEDAAEGAINYPQPTQVLPAAYANFTDYCNDVTKRASNPLPGQAPSTIPALCRPGVTADQQAAALAFASGASVPEDAAQKFNNWLPSLNVRLDITPKLLMRLAVSKAIVRPNFTDLRDFVSLGFDGTNGVFTARSSNPYLKPIRANQADLTAEWYFAKVGSLTGAVFYKDVQDVILQNTGFERSFTNGGNTEVLGLTGPTNVAGHGHIYGAELSYQQTYDFLPGPLSGFGTQGTFTVIKQNDFKISPPSFRASSDPTPNEGDGNQPPEDITGLYSGLPLPGLSKYLVNAAVFYDKYGFYARVAYNWRSKFLLTTQDCCFPFLPVYQKANGTLDASAFYTIDAHIKIGIEGSNLLDTTTKTTFVLNGDGLEAPRSFFKADRQYTATLRMTF